MHLQTKGLDLDPSMIGVIEQGGNDSGLGVIANRRATGTRRRERLQQLVEQQLPLAVQRVVHHRRRTRFKVGMNNAYGYHENLSYLPNTLAFRFNNGVPNQIDDARAAAHGRRTTSIRTSASSRRTSGRSTG